MLDRRLDVRLALRVFNAVRERGERRGESYFWQGMAVSSDYDGYTLELSDGRSTARVYFHNKYDFEGPSRILRQEFIDRLKRIDKMHRPES